MFSFYELTAAREAVSLVLYGRKVVGLIAPGGSLPDWVPEVCLTNVIASIACRF